MYRYCLLKCSILHQRKSLTFHTMAFCPWHHDRIPYSLTIIFSLDLFNIKFCWKRWADLKNGSPSKARRPRLVHTNKKITTFVFCWCVWNSLALCLSLLKKLETPNIRKIAQNFFCFGMAGIVSVSGIARLLQGFQQNNYYGLHMTHPGCTLPNKSFIILIHSRKDCFA